MAAKNVVVIGGGTGTHLLLRGLKRYNVRLTALISTFDASRWGADGPWTFDVNAAAGRDELRSSLLALGADPAATQIMERLFAYRLAEPGGQDGPSFGNLFLRALTEITGTTDQALQAATQVLNVQGRVLPLTLHGKMLAELADGSEVVVSSPAELSTRAAQDGLRAVRPAQPAPVLDAAIQAIHDADVIVLGPSDLFFNVVGPLQLDEFRTALTASTAVKIFVCNILTQPHTTDGWTCSRYIRHVLSYLGGPDHLDYAVINSTPLDAVALEHEAAAGALPVALDLEECLSLGLDIIVRPVAAGHTLQHDGEKLARTILFLGGERVQRRAPGALERPAEPVHAPGYGAPTGRPPGTLRFSPQGAK